MIQEFHRPRTVREALETKARYGADARYLCGGSDLLVKLRAGHVHPRAIIDLGRIDSLRGIRHTKTEVVFGATATAAECIRDPWVQKSFPAMWRACQWLGGPQMQHVGTLGGNLGNASPAADTVPALMVAGAKVKLVSLEGSRSVAFEDFLVGPGRTSIAPGEMITEIRVPARSFAPADPRPLLNEDDAFRLNVIPHHGPARDASEFTANMFYKAGARLAQVISIACVAGWARMKGRKVLDIRLAYGSAAPVTRRGANAEDTVRGRELTPALIEAAVDAVQRDISPIDDVRGSANYKRLICANYTRLFLQDLAGFDLTGVTPAQN